MNQKGFEMVWSTIVIIILSLMLLLFIILFFTNSSGSFINNVKGYFSYSNVDSVVQSCNLLTQSGNIYNFCCEKKSIKYYNNGEKTQNEFSCNELINKIFIAGKINSLNCEGINC